MTSNHSRHPSSSTRRRVIQSTGDDDEEEDVKPNIHLLPVPPPEATANLSLHPISNLTANSSSISYKQSSSLNHFSHPFPPLPLAQSSISAQGPISNLVNQQSNVNFLNQQSTSSQCRPPPSGFNQFGSCSMSQISNDRLSSNSSSLNEPSSGIGRLNQQLMLNQLSNQQSTRINQFGTFSKTEDCSSRFSCAPDVPFQHKLNRPESANPDDGHLSNFSNVDDERKSRDPRLYFQNRNQSGGGDHLSESRFCVNPPQGGSQSRAQPLFNINVNSNIHLNNYPRGFSDHVVRLSQLNDVPEDRFSCANLNHRVDNQLELKRALQQPESGRHVETCGPNLIPFCNLERPPPNFRHSSESLCQLRPNQRSAVTIGPPPLLTANVTGQPFVDPYSRPLGAVNSRSHTNTFANEAGGSNLSEHSGRRASDFQISYPPPSFVDVNIRKSSETPRSSCQFAEKHSSSNLPLASGTNAERGPLGRPRSPSNSSTNAPINHLPYDSSSSTSFGEHSRTNPIHPRGVAVPLPPTPQSASTYSFKPPPLPRLLMSSSDGRSFFDRQNNIDLSVPPPNLITNWPSQSQRQQQDGLSSMRSSEKSKGLLNAPSLTTGVRMPNPSSHPLSTMLANVANNPMMTSSSQQDSSQSSTINFQVNPSQDEYHSSSTNLSKFTSAFNPSTSFSPIVPSQKVSAAPMQTELAPASPVVGTNFSVPINLNLPPTSINVNVPPTSININMPPTSINVNVPPPSFLYPPPSLIKSETGALTSYNVQLNRNSGHASGVFGVGSSTSATSGGGRTNESSVVSHTTCGNRSVWNAKMDQRSGVSAWRDEKTDGGGLRRDRRGEERRSEYERKTDRKRKRQSRSRSRDKQEKRRANRRREESGGSDSDASAEDRRDDRGKKSRRRSGSRERSYHRYRESETRSRSRDRRGGTRARSRESDRSHNRANSRDGSDRYRTRDNVRNTSRDCDRYDGSDRSGQRSYSRLSRRNDSRSPSSSNRNTKSNNRHRSRTPPGRASVESESTHHQQSSERNDFLNKWRLNNCQSEDEMATKFNILATMDADSIIAQEEQIWSRSAPADLHYTLNRQNLCYENTSKVDILCNKLKSIIDNYRQIKASKPSFDYTVNRKNVRNKCKHCGSGGGHSESEDEEDLDATDDGTEDVEENWMKELELKQKHPDRLHTELWFNDKGEMNDGPLCRCSNKSRRSGIRHNIYQGEEVPKHCNVKSNNSDKLYHYRITVSPPTNFLINKPTVIKYDGHEYIFEGFSLFSHYPLTKLPVCKVIRFNIQYTIVYIEEKVPTSFSVQETDLFFDYLFHEILELYDLDLNAGQFEDDGTMKMGAGGKGRTEWKRNDGAGENEGSASNENGEGVRKNESGNACANRCTGEKDDENERKETNGKVVRKSGSVVRSCLSECGNANRSGNDERKSDGNAQGKDAASVRKNERCKGHCGIEEMDKVGERVEIENQLERNEERSFACARNDDDRGDVSNEIEKRCSEGGVKNRNEDGKVAGEDSSRRETNECGESFSRAQQMEDQERSINGGCGKEEAASADVGGSSSKEKSRGCPQFHLMPRFVRELEENGKELLPMYKIIEYFIQSFVPVISDELVEQKDEMSTYEWQDFVDEIKGMVVTKPGSKPSSIRVDQLDRESENKDVFPDIIHFGIRPPQLSYAGNPQYQKLWKDYVKLRHLVANKPKKSDADKKKLSEKEVRLQQIRNNSKMKRGVTVAISSRGFYRTGVMCDMVQHAMLIPVLLCHLRFHQSLNVLEDRIKYKFKNRYYLQLALTHPSYRENFGTNPDHARNSLTNCGIRQPEYGDRRIHFQNTRKRGINTLISIMSKLGRKFATESNITHNERLEFLGDAVVEFVTSIHLFHAFPHIEEGGLATFRAAVVQNQNLASLAKKVGLEEFMLYAHGSDLCHELELRHAMANCYEALMGALFLDGGMQVADDVFSRIMLADSPQEYHQWILLPKHPLQQQEPEDDRSWVDKSPVLDLLQNFERLTGITFKHIRLLARVFTTRSLGFTNLTLGSNQRLEFLGDTVLQLITSDFLYNHFPEHHEGHLSLLRSSLVNNRTQSVVCNDIGMPAFAYAINPKLDLKMKDRADLLEALLGAMYIDKGMDACRSFCHVCFFPRLQYFILNQEWNDPKSKLQQCCLTLRTLDGGEPDIPIYKVIECIGPTNSRIYTVAVYFQNVRLARSTGNSIQAAEMNAAKQALESSESIFPQLSHQKRVIAKTLQQQMKST